MGVRLYELARGVWRVDGKKIRDCYDIEFTNCGHHFDHEYIPINEVWVDHEAPTTEEWRAFAARKLEELRLINKGTPPDRARSMSVAAERLVREAWLREDELASLYDQSAHIRVVSGKAVRDWLYLDFTQGGHSLVYSFVPPNAIWIDDALTIEEVPAVVEHEKIEMFLMRRGLSYEDAHELANRREKLVRVC